MNIDYLNRVGTAHNNFKTHEMRLNEENQNLKKEIERLKEENDILCSIANGEKEKEEKILELINRINKAIEYIEEHCIDDEFYINLSNKEKGIIDVLNILKGVDKE